MPFNAVHTPHQVPDEYLKPYANLKGERKKYAGMLAAMDEGVGKIVAAVEKAGVRENTLFLFSSDNGGPSPGTVTDNGKYRAGKGTLYEGGLRVHPGSHRGRRDLGGAPRSSVAAMRAGGSGGGARGSVA